MVSSRIRTRCARPTTLYSSIWVIEYYERTVTCTLVFTSCYKDAWRIYSRSGVCGQDIHWDEIFWCIHQIAGVLCVNLRQRGSSAPSSFHFTAGTVISFWQRAKSVIQCTQTGFQELIQYFKERFSLYPVLYSVVLRCSLCLGESTRFSLLSKFKSYLIS